MRLTIDPKTVLADVSPNLFGHFVEMMFDCVDPGMWAQLLTARGFESPDANGDGVPDAWTPTGRNDSYEYALEYEDVLAPKCAQRITVFVHFGGYRGVRQAVCLNQSCGYTGYAWLKGEAGVRASVSVTAEDGRVLGRADAVLAGDGWQKVAFHVDGDACVPHAFFEVRLESSGSLLIDQCSLMPDNAIGGIWQPVMAHIAALHPSVIRYPGGCFADSYHFEDGLGPIDLRPTGPNVHWGGIEQNHLGTDEFIAFCRNVNAQPLICINFAATPEEAAAWVQYVNGAADTPYGQKRAANGHPEPYGVLYWDVGNETFGDWELFHCTAEDYAARFQAFAKAMKAVDPSIIILACAGDANYHDQSWNRAVLQQASADIDILALHMYAPMIKREICDNVALHYTTAGAPVKYQTILDETVATLREVSGNARPIRLAITEWNTNYANESLREHSLEAGLFSAGLLNLMLRNALHVVMANCSDLVNGWPGGIIRSEKGVVQGTATYHAICLYAGAKPVQLLASQDDSARYDSQAFGNVESLTDVPLVDITCCRDAEGRVLVFAVNRSLDEDIPLTIDGLAVSGFEHAEIWAGQTSDDRVTVTKTDAEGAQVTLRRHSINRLTLHTCD